jgi:hypothetical protein
VRTTEPHPAVEVRSRRGVLRAGTAAAGAAALAACSGGAGSARRPAATSASGPPRARAARRTSGLIAAYDATLRAHPGLAHELRPLRAELALHLEAFGGPPAGAPPSPSGSPPASAPASPAPSVPASPAAARRALARAEQRVSDAHSAALLTAPPGLARLLASVAAAGAGHVLLLRS